MDAQTIAETGDARSREAHSTVAVYPPLPFVPQRAEGCHLVLQDERRILDLYGGHAVASLGYSNPDLVAAVTEQASRLLFQSNAVALEERADAAERLLQIAPSGLERVFFVNSGAEANENALRMACRVTGRHKILAITHGFHGRTAAAAAVTWNSASWYGFHKLPFDVDFIPRDDVAAAVSMIDNATAAVIFEPVQGVAGGYDLSRQFVTALREETSRHGALLIADEVQTGMGRCGHFFASETNDFSLDILTSAKALGGGFPCGAVLCSGAIAKQFGAGDLGSTFGGGPMAAAAISATIKVIQAKQLLKNVRDREEQIRSSCIVGPITRIQGKGLLLGLVCDQPASAIRDALLALDILTGTSADPRVIRILAPLILQPQDVAELRSALLQIPVAP